MQNINVYRDPLAPDDETAYCVDPSDASVWRNDQDVMWTLISSTYQFLTVVFDADWVAAGGVQPVVDPANPMSATAQGPGPNAANQATPFRYTMALQRTVRTGNPAVDTIRVGRRKGAGGIVIDPDVWNQPQP